jgi:hypothetical protein
MHDDDRDLIVFSQPKPEPKTAILLGAGLLLTFIGILGLLFIAF